MFCNKYYFDICPTTIKFMWFIYLSSNVIYHWEVTNLLLIQTSLQHRQNLPRRYSFLYHWIPLLSKIKKRAIDQFIGLWFKSQKENFSEFSKELRCVTMVEVTLLTLPMNHSNKLLELRQEKYFLREQNPNQAPFKTSFNIILEFHL